MNKLKFHKFDGTFIENVNEYVKLWIKEHPYCTVTIGCDSQEHARHIQYAVTICLHNKDRYGIGHGAHVVVAQYKDSNRNMKSDIYTKLWGEAELTIEAAQMIESAALEFHKKITIHLDYNSDENEYSNVLYAAGIGYAQSMGFEAVGKPWAYAASSVADRYCR
jgi:uncharacterized protein